METRFYKVISYVEVFVPNDMHYDDSKKLAEVKARNDDDMFLDNLGAELEEVKDPFEFMSKEFRLAVDMFEKYDLDECKDWFEKARFNVEVEDDG
jgi:hypothetical protein